MSDQSETAIAEAHLAARTAHENACEKRVDIKIIEGSEHVVITDTNPFDDLTLRAAIHADAAGRWKRELSIEVLAKASYPPTGERDAGHTLAVVLPPMHAVDRVRAWQILGEVMQGHLTRKFTTRSRHSEQAKRDGRDAGRRAAKKGSLTPQQLSLLASLDAMDAACAAEGQIMAMAILRESPAVELFKLFWPDKDPNDRVVSVYWESILGEGGMARLGDHQWHAVVVGDSYDRCWRQLIAYVDGAQHTERIVMKSHRNPNTEDWKR